MQLRGVLLDLDDTLLDQRGAVRRALFDWLPALGVTPTPALHQLWVDLQEHHLVAWRERTTTFQEQRRRRLREFLGAAKLDPSAFSLACSRWGLPPSAVLSVGDRHDLDALAARAAGLHAVHLDRHDEGPHDEASRVTSLAALPALIREQFPSARVP